MSKLFALALIFGITVMGYTQEKTTKIAKKSGEKVRAVTAEDAKRSKKVILTKKDVVANAKKAVNVKEVNRDSYRGEGVNASNRAKNTSAKVKTDETLQKVSKVKKEKGVTTSKIGNKNTKQTKKTVKKSSKNEKILKKKNNNLL